MTQELLEIDEELFQLAYASCIEGKPIDQARFDLLKTRRQQILASGLPELEPFGPNDGE